MHNSIKVINAEKRFREQLVLNNISVNFEQGKIYGIVGRNGSGKTVLFKCICGLMPLTKGKIIVNDKIIGKDIDVPKNIGVIIEVPGFIPNYSGYKNLKLLAAISKKADKKRIKECIKTVGLDPDSKKHVSKYSMGMRQRLGIAQAIMEDPNILILDEPMNGLDDNGVTQMRELILSLKNSNITIIISSHNQDDIDYLCDTVYQMHKGNISKIR